MVLELLTKKERGKLNDLKSDERIVITNKRLPYRIFLSRVIDIQFSAHKYIEIIYVIKGIVKLNIRDNILILNEGDFYIIGSKKAHSIQCKTEDNILMFFQIRSEYLEENFGIPEGVTFSNDINNIAMRQNILYALGSLYMEKLNTQSKYDVHVSKLGDLVDVIKPYLLDDTDSNYIDKKETVEFIVYDIIEKYAYTVGEEDISLEKIALEYNVSYAYLSRIFKKVTGINFTRYFLKQRLNKVADLLLNTNKTVTETASCSGFSDVKALNRDFKKMFGMPPTEFRNVYNIDNIINEDIFLNDYSVKKFFKKVEKEKIKKYRKMPIENRNYNLDISTIVGINKKVWGKIIDFDYIINNDISYLNNILKEINFKSVEMKFKYKEDRFLLVTKNGILKELSKIEASKLVRILDNNNIIPIVQLDFVSKNEKAFYKDEDIFYHKCCSKFKSALDFVSMIIGNSKLAKWKFELCVPEINQLVINNDDSSILFNHIDYFVNTLEERFGQNNYSWGLYIGKVEITEKKEDIIYIKELKKLSRQPEFYRLDLICYYKSFVCKMENYSLTDNIDNLIDEVNKYLNMYKTEKKQKLICTFNIVDDMELPEEYSILYYNLFLNWILLNVKRDGLYISSCKVTDYEFENKVNYHTFYDEFGIKLISYYASRFIEELKTDIIYFRDGCFATKQDEDIVVLLHNDYKKYSEYIEHSYDIKDKQVEKKIILNIIGLQGRYKITEYQIDYTNSSFYYKFIQDIDVESMNKEERMYIQSRIMPEMKIKFLNIQNSLKYFTKLKCMGTSLIKLQKV